MFKLLCLTGAVVLALTGGARAQSDFLTHFMGGQGCAVGPEAKMAPHLPSQSMYQALRDYAETALADGKAERQGDWIVLGPEICRIRPPVVDTPVAFVDPAVQDAVGAFVSNEEFEEYGCFLESDKLQSVLISRRGMTEDAAALAYLLAVADGVIKGEATFFSDNVLVTPLGFQSLIGACADVPKIDAIRHSQALMLAHFDTLVRENAKQVNCEETGSPIVFETSRWLAEQTDGAATNAWVMLDILVLAAGAGWIEGIGATERGTPRPPICSYE